MQDIYRTAGFNFLLQLTEINIDEDHSPNLGFNADFIFNFDDDVKESIGDDDATLTIHLDLSGNFTIRRELASSFNVLQNLFSTIVNVYELAEKLGLPADLEEIKALKNKLGV